MSKPELPAEESSGRFSLHGLSAAFARLTGSSGNEPSQAKVSEALEELEAPQQQGAILGEVLSPQIIVEGMLFVGKSEGEPLTNREMAANIRDVSPSEIDQIIVELNNLYAETSAPYEIVSTGAGYQMQIRKEFDPLRQRFYGRVREAKLTPPAIEVLSIVAYRQPVTSDDVTKLRGAQSRAILNQLVRRGLLSLERPEATPKKPNYFTTDRFNHLFQINSPQDLPSNEDLDDK